MRYSPLTPLLVLAVAILLPACTTMNQDDCLSADWYALGLETGSGGQGRDQLERQRDACGKHGIPVDQAAWLEGYEYGLDDFCTPINGYEHGRHGRSYRGVCPAHLEGGFLLGYQQGRELYVAEQRVARVDHTIQERAAQIDDARYRIYRYQEILAHRDSSEADRRHASANIRYLQRDIHILRQHMWELNAHRTDAIRQLMQLQAQGGTVGRPQ